MASLTTLELLSPPKDVVRQAQAQIAMARQQDASNQPKLMAAASPTNVAAPPVGISADFTSRFVNGKFLYPSSSSGTGRTLGDVLADPQVTMKAYEDITTLSDLIRSARGSFHMVELVVRDIDRAPLVQDDRPPWMFAMFPMATVQGGSPLSKKFYEITQGFEGALKSSIQVAPMAISSMNSVNDILGSASGKTQGELKARLQTFMEEVKVKEAEALGVKDQFQHVVDRLRTFWADVEAALAHSSISANVTSMIQNLSARIADLTRQLESLNQMLGSLNSTILSEVATGGIGAAMTIFQLCPSMFFSIMNEAFGFGSVGNLLNSTVQQIDSVKAQLESARQEMTQEQQQQAILQDPKSFLDAAALKLDGVVNIWQTINLDMHALYTDLSTNISDDAPVTVFFLAKMTVAKEIYEKLAWVLGIYVGQMRSLTI